MATINYKQLSTPEANLIELLSAQNQDGTYSAKLMGSEPFSVLAAKTIYNTYNDIESNMAADVEGPASSTDNALARFDGTTGKLIQNSNAILTDAGALSLASNLTVSGTSGVTSSGTVWGFLSNNATQNGYAFYASGASADQKYWHWQNGSAVGDGTLRLRALNDALTNGTNALIITRTGISSTAVEVGGNLTVSGTGTSSVAGTLNVSGGFILNRINAKGIYTGTSDNCGFTWTGTNGEFSTASGSLILKSAGTTALTLDSSLNATFAGNVTAIKAGTAFYSIESTVNGALSEVIVKGKNSVGTAREARLGLNKYADDVFSIYDGTTERFRLGLTNGDATFAGRSSATTAYGTAKSVTVDFATSTATNVTRTFTVTIPSPGLAGTFLLEVGVYGNGATGLGSLLVKGYGYFGSTSLYDATEISKVSTGNVTVSSITKGNGSFTFTVLDTTSSALVAVKYSQTSDAAITTLPTITSA